MQREDTKHRNFESQDCALKFGNKLTGSASAIKRLMEVAIGALRRMADAFAFAVSARCLGARLAPARPSALCSALSTGHFRVFPQL